MSQATNNNWYNKIPLTHRHQQGKIKNIIKEDKIMIEIDNEEQEKGNMGLSQR